MRIKTTREKRILIIKTTIRWILYYILIFFCFVLMTSGTMLKPLLLTPAALCIAVGNDQIASAVTGAVCGFLLDISCGRLFGYNAVILTFFCIAVSLIFDLYLRNRFINILIVCTAVSFIQCWLDYKFYYEIWNYENTERIFHEYTLPVWGLTVIASVFIYLIIKMINHFLLPKEHLTLEEAIKTM